MIIFANPGLIDLDAVFLMGVNAKLSSSAIGYFGTGAKFAVATLLRHGCEIAIFRGDKYHRLSTSEIETRGKAFKVVTLDGLRLGFTTELGRNWQPWQAYRELFTNAKDEGGGVVQGSDDLLLKAASASDRVLFGQIAQLCSIGQGYNPDNSTVIVVIGAAIEQAHAARADFLLDGTPDFTTTACDIFNRPSKGIFYRGVLVKSLPQGITNRFTYNIKQRIDLTEDRTAQYDFQIHEAISAATDELADREQTDMATAILCPPEAYKFEHEIDFNGILGADTRSPGFLKLVGELAKTRDAELSPHARKAYHRIVKEDLEEKVQPFELSAVQTEQMKRAVAFADRLGFAVLDYPIIFAERLGNGVHGMALNGKIYLARDAFEKGTKEVAGTLIEEFIHLRHGLLDETRAMQTFLFDKIVSLGEMIAGEPL